MGDFNACPNETDRPTAANDTKSTVALKEMI
jgi:hypothetical protein